MHAGAGGGTQPLGLGMDTYADNTIQRSGLRVDQGDATRHTGTLDVKVVWCSRAATERM